MGADEGRAIAKRILDWVKRTGQATFRKQELWQALRGGVPTVEPLDKALDALCNRGFIREAQQGTMTGKAGRKPSIFEVNPDFLGR